MNPNTEVWLQKSRLSSILRSTMGNRQRSAISNWCRLVESNPNYKIQSVHGPEVICGGHKMIMLCSDDYLGLSSHRKIKEATVSAIKKYGTGCAGSRLLNGSLDIHEELEHRIAKLLNKESAILFPSGYQANLGTIAALVGRGDVALVDADCEPSIFDGGKLAFGQILGFEHQDISDMERLLIRHQESDVLIVVDGVFQPGGDAANLSMVYDMCQHHGAGLMVNDTYGFGLIGADGSGCTQSVDLSQGVHVITGSFSKALGATGGFAAANGEVVDYLKHNARSLIFSASLAPPTTAAVLAALDILQAEPERRSQVMNHARYFTAVLRGMGYDCGDAEGPLIPIVFDAENQALDMWQRLFDAGVLTMLLPNTVSSKPGGLIKTSLMASHTQAQLDRVLDVFAETSKMSGLRDIA